MHALTRRLPFPLRLARPNDPDRDAGRNPYPPPSPPTPPPPTPPAWFQRYWPVVFTIVSFLAGLWFLNQDLRDGSVEPVAAIIYGTMMGYLPISLAAQLFKR